ncbi:hypothetical protein [Pseudoflavonifractor phocaeensis]|uniref:hypothetical protein n=1 Tax=Pseudoflavonifractor phocaeensis TaxID=1870988 RepID=UPI00210E146C|nr:hypothetical protein [Pseudoflavonifractor phocaeensis]MCQ4866168.1 hypothetical protein [Pseudoflavonifractor phocaeensis]
MKKAKNLLKAVLFTFLILFTIFALIFCLRTTFWHIESPGGDYQILGWLTDKGGFGYSGNYYVRENSLFSQWHYLGSGPSRCQWESETTFSVFSPNGTQNYTVFDFINN